MELDVVILNLCVIHLLPTFIVVLVAVGAEELADVLEGMVVAVNLVLLEECVVLSRLLAMAL